ncbi:MAG: hypothetical protein AAFQ54_11865, partial [Pseudomonadota bacterium]
MPFLVDMDDLGNDLSLKYDALTSSIQVYDRTEGTQVGQKLLQQLTQVRVAGTSGDDVLELDFSDSFVFPVEVVFDGLSGSDTVMLSGGAGDAVSLKATRAGDALVQMTDDGETGNVRLGDIETVVDTTQANERVFHDYSGNANSFSLSGGGAASDGQTRIKTDGALLDYVFAAPEERVRIAAYEGDDTFDIFGLDADAAATYVLQGGTGTDTVTGPPTDTVWNITGHNEGNVVGVAFSAVENLVGAADNDDTFVVAATGALDGVMDGGDGGFDSMILSGGTFETVTYVATGSTSGTIDRDGSLLTYDGLEPITDMMVIDDRVIDASAISDTTTLVDNNDGTMTFASTDLIPTFEQITFAKATNSLTVNLGDDLGVLPFETDIPLVAGDSLSVGALDMAGAVLTIDGQDGLDTVTFTGDITNADAINVTAEQIVVDGGVTITGTSVNFTAEATADALALASDAGVYVALPLADVTVLGTVAASAGDVVISASATSNLDAATVSLGPVGGAIITAIPSATISVGDASDPLVGGTITATGNVDLDTAISLTVMAADEADAGDTDASVDAAVVVTVALSTSEIGVSGTSAIGADGDVTLNAATVLDITSTADGTAGTAGATVAVTEVQADTRVFVSDTASIGGNLDAADSVSLGAELTSTVATTSTATSGGATDGGGGARESEERLADPNKDGDTSDVATTGTESGDEINFAGAVVVSDYRPVTEAFIDSDGTIATDAGTVTVAATATESISASASGVNTGSGATGVGVAVAVGVVDTTVSARLGGNTTYDAASIDVAATLNAGASYVLTAISGAGDAGNVGAAGSLAVQVVSTNVESLVVDGAALILNGADLSLTATATTASTTSATPDEDNAGGGAEFGIGASVALYVADNTVTAALQGNALDSALYVAPDAAGLGALTLTATADHDDTTTAEGGSSGGGTALGGAVAITVVDNITTADLGDTGLLEASGDVDAKTIHSGQSLTMAGGMALGGSTAVGAAIALAFVDNRGQSNLRRSLTSAGTASFTADVDGASKATAKASAAGADTTDEAAEGNGTADDQKDSVTALANQKSGDGDTTSSESSATTDDGNGSGGSVGVGAALAVNVSTAEATATIEAVTLDAAGLVLSASNNADGAALADGSAAAGGADGGTQVGVAIAINVASADTTSAVRTGADVNITGEDGVAISATMKDVEGNDSHDFQADAKAGASGGDTGIAGAFALGITGATTQAAVETGADVDAGTGDVTLSAAANSTDTVTAGAAQEGGSTTGVGASVAIGVSDYATTAEIANGAILTGGANLTLTAAGDHDATTTATSGAAAGDGTGVGGAIAIDVHDRATTARVGTGAPLTLTGNLAATATHSGSSETTADSDVTGGNAAVGVSIALAFVDDDGTATLARDATVAGTASFTADVDGASKATAKASAAGAD